MQRNYLEKHNACLSVFPCKYSACFLLAGSQAHLTSLPLCGIGRRLLNWQNPVFYTPADKMYRLFCVATQITCMHRHFLNFKSTQEFYCVQKEEPVHIFVGKKIWFLFLSVCILATNVRWP